MGTYFKTQSKLTHFIKSMFQKHEIVGPHIWQYIISLDLWSSVILDKGLKCTIENLRKYIFRNKPSEKAELFNNYFYDQFSGPSDYNINIGWSNDQVFDIDLDQNKVRKLLLNINSNKASGPDGIHGKILQTVLTL